MNGNSARPLLSSAASTEYDRLVSKLRSGKTADFGAVLEALLEETSDSAIFAFFLDLREELNLRSLRVIFNRLRSSGRTDMALPVISAIRETTGKNSDYLAERRLEVDWAIQEVESYRVRSTRSERSWADTVSDGLAEEWTERLRLMPAYAAAAEWFEIGTQRNARDVIGKGWKYQEFPQVEIGPDIDWVNLPIEDRSWRFHFQAWEFLDSVVTSYVKSREEDLLDWALQTATSWAQTVVIRGESSPMAWYDMAVALRSARLASLIRLAIEAGKSADELRDLYIVVLAQRDALEAEDAFNSRNNHGFYAALGQLVLATALQPIDGMEFSLRQGSARMGLMARQQFHSDGGHAEHSPDYHRMLLASFTRAIKFGLITDSEVVERIEKAVEILGWLVEPSGRILQFGDSPGKMMLNRPPKSTNEKTRFIQTDGLEGHANDAELLSLPRTGYAIVRTPQPSRAGELQKSSYLALAAGFHSRAHKHCDDLSIVWTHRGEEILVDGGRYGYGSQLPPDSPLRSLGFYYAAPERQYAESVRAHNTVSLDGEDHDRRRRPYGSGLVSAEQDGDMFHIIGEVPHGGWSHRRSITMERSGILTITDEVFVDDGEEHVCDLYFNLSGNLMLEKDADGTVKILTPAGTRLRASWNAGGNVTLVKGQEDPLWGWRSINDRELVPTWGLRRRQNFTGELRVVTYFEQQIA